MSLAPPPYTQGDLVWVTAFDGGSKDEYERFKLAAPCRGIVDECDWNDEDGYWHVFIFVEGVPGFGMAWEEHVRPLTAVERLAELA